MKKTMSLFFFMVAVTFIGCARAYHTYTADGKEGYCVDCSGSALTWGDCYKKAGEICQGSGYDVLEKSGDSTSMVSGTQFGLFGGGIITRTLVIKCKP